MAKKTPPEKPQIFCVKHGKDIATTQFYMANLSSIFAGLGKIPFCKSCLYKMMDEYFKKTNNAKLSMYYMCGKMDVAFNNNIYDSCVKESQSSPIEIFKAYMTQYNSLGTINGTQLNFDKGEHPLFDEDGSIVEDEVSNIEITSDTKLFWGSGFNMNDYIFLEKELEAWRQTHKCDNRAELTLLKEICIKILKTRQKRETNEDVSKDLKDLQELMKTASVDPAKSNAINAGENVDRFGVWIKDIERLKPAEWWDDQEKYKDMDGFLPYIKNYIVRPIKNFFTGSKDFLINGEDLSFKEKEDSEDE